MHQSKISMSSDETQIRHSSPSITLSADKLNLVNSGASVKMSAAVVTVNDGALEVT